MAERQQRRPRHRRAADVGGVPWHRIGDDRLIGIAAAGAGIGQRIGQRLAGSGGVAADCFDQGDGGRSDGEGIQDRVAGGGIGLRTHRKAQRTAVAFAGIRGGVDGGQQRPGLGGGQQSGICKAIAIAVPERGFPGVQDAVAIEVVVVDDGGRGEAADDRCCEGERIAARAGVGQGVRQGRRAPAAHGAGAVGLQHHAGEEGGPYDAPWSAHVVINLIRKIQAVG